MSFEGSFRNLTFSPSTSILLNFPFTDITCFFSSLKLQYCRTIVLLNKLKLFKETSFSKATIVTRLPANKNVGYPKTQRDFFPRKDGILHPSPGCHGTPSRSPESVRAYGRTDVRTYADVTTKISRIDRFPNLLGNGTPL